VLIVHKAFPDIVVSDNLMHTPLDRAGGAGRGTVSGRLVRRCIQPIVNEPFLFSFRLKGLVSWDMDETVNRQIWECVFSYFVQKEKVDTSCTEFGNDVCFAEVVKFSTYPPQSYSYITCRVHEMKPVQRTENTSLFPLEMYTKYKDDKLVLITHRLKTHKGEIGCLLGFVLTSDTEWKVGGDGNYNIAFSHIRPSLKSSLVGFKECLLSDISLTSSRDTASYSNSYSIGGLNYAQDRGAYDMDSNDLYRDDSNSNSTLFQEDQFKTPLHFYLPCHGIPSDATPMDLHDVVKSVWDLFRILKFCHLAVLHKKSPIPVLEYADAPSKSWNMFKWSTTLTPYSERARTMTAVALSFIMQVLNMEEKRHRDFVVESFMFAAESAIDLCAFGDMRQRKIVAGWAGTELARMYDQNNFIPTVKKATRIELMQWVQAAAELRKAHGSLSSRMASFEQWDAQKKLAIGNLDARLANAFSEHDIRSRSVRFDAVDDVNVYGGLQWTGNPNDRAYFLMCMLDTSITKEWENMKIEEDV